jgi:hypothetical protein
MRGLGWGERRKLARQRRFALQFGWMCINAMAEIVDTKPARTGRQFL